MENNEMYIVCKVKKKGTDTLVSLITMATTNHAEYIRMIPGVGKPYLIFATMPDGHPQAAFLDDPSVPIVSQDVNVNQAAINEMLANPPWDLLLYS